MEMITSRQNERIKQAALLKHRSGREESGLFFFEGAHLLEEYLRFGHTPECVYATEKALAAYRELLAPVSGRVVAVTDEVYARLTEEMSPQGLFCVSRAMDNICENGVPRAGSLIAESVRDPGNLGTMIRTAAALGVGSVIVSADCADIYSPKTVRASMGAIFTLPVIRTGDLKEAVETLKKSGSRVYAAMLDSSAVRLGSFETSPGDCFVIGNEGAGITEGLAAACGGKVFIPMSGLTESLNAAAAATVIMWEMTRGKRS